MRTTESGKSTEHQVLFIVPDNGLLLEVSGIMDIFNQANKVLADHSLPPYYKFLIATNRKDKIIHGSSGMKILADKILSDLSAATSFDSIFVTGGGMNPHEPDIVAWLRQAAPQAKRIASICTGTYFLAQAGLLQGREATTHWKCAKNLQQDFPGIKVNPDPIFVHDGQIYTSAGATSGFDLALAMIEEDLGQKIALGVARHLVIYLKRPGTQSQFSIMLKHQAKEPGPIRDIQDWAVEHLSEDLRIEQLASKAAMSPRNFARVFAQQVGTTPAKFIEELRIEVARQQLEQTSETVDRIAWQCGFGTATSMRRLFERHINVSPSEYRARFQSSGIKS